MNDQQLETKIRHDGAKVRKDVDALVADGTAQVKMVTGKVTQATGKAKEGITTWVEDGVSQISDGFEKLTDAARVTVTGATAAVRKDIGHGLSQYNAKAQEVADRVPGGFSVKATSYPWVAISIALVVGFLLGGFLKPARSSVG